MSLFSFVSREPAGCAIEVGSPYSDSRTRTFYPALSEVKIEISRKKAGEGTLTFDSRRDMTGRWEIEDSGVFDEWTPIQVSAVFGVRPKQEVICGFVRDVAVTHPPNSGESTVTVGIQDMSLKADRLHRKHVWGAESSETDYSIFTKILQRNGLSCDSESSFSSDEIQLNQDGTDADLLRKQAADRGVDLLYEGSLVYFGPPRLEDPTQPPIVVEGGPLTNAISFDAKIDGTKPDFVRIEIPPDKKGNHVDPITKKPDSRQLGVSPLTSGDLDDHTFVMKGKAGPQLRALEAKAQAKVNELSFKLTAEGELDGTLYGTVLKVGRTVRVAGVGYRLSGTFLVDSATHVFNTDGYRIQFKLIRNAVGDDLEGGVGGFAGIGQTLAGLFG